MDIILQEFILMLVIYTGSLSAEPRLFMDVKVGRSAVLPCDWRTILDNLSSDQKPHIEWKTFAGTVFERRGKEHYEGDRYEGRVDVPEDELKKGNCSLELKEVKAEDAGLYESYLLVNRVKRALNSRRVFIQSVELSVDDTPEEINSAQNKQNAQARSSGLSETLNSSGVINFPSPTITFTILTIILLFVQCFPSLMDRHLVAVERLARSEDPESWSVFHSGQKDLRVRIQTKSDLPTAFNTTIFS